MQTSGKPITMLLIINLICIKCALIDYSIASEYRGRGLGYVIIELISEKVRCMKNVNSLVAHVKAANVASKRVFLKNGFLEYANESLFTLSYKKNI